jgi:O-antigen ligase
MSNSGSPRLNATAFLILLLIALAPLAYLNPSRATRSVYGGGEPGHRGDLAIELLAFACLACTLLSQPDKHGLGRARLPIAAALSLAILGLAQMVPLPQAVLARISPVSRAVYRQTADLLALYGHHHAPLPRISLAPLETAEATLLILAYVALFVSAALLIDRAARRRVFLFTIIASGLAQTLAASVLQYRNDRLQGLFVNPNHFAGYLEISLFLALGVLWAELVVGSDRIALDMDAASRFEKRAIPLAIRLLCWSVLAAGIALTKSRGGMLAASISTGLILALAFSRVEKRSRRRLALTTLAALAVGITFVAWTTREGALSRFLTLDPRDLESNSRVVLWKTSLAAFRQFPIAGCGLGAFAQAFRRVQPRDFVHVVEEAHCDSLQLLVTGGLVGASLGLLLWITLTGLLYLAWRRQRHRREAALILGSLGALLCLTLHGFVEFNFSIPPIPATLAAVLGMAWALRADTVRSSPLPRRRSSAEPARRSLASGISPRAETR